LLIVRELMFGPRRYTDLLAGLPRVSSSVLTLRLRELEEAELIARRQLAPPAASTVYELTDHGEELRPVIDAVGRWGLRLMDQPRRGEALSPLWMTYSLSVSIPLSVVPDRAAIVLDLDGERHTLRRRGDALEARWGDNDDATAVITSSLLAMYFVVSGQADHRDLERREELAISGDTRLARQVLDAATDAWHAL
jgi:DNA-binding HxlR family transcriptional regulator